MYLHITNENVIHNIVESIIDNNDVVAIDFYDVDYIAIDDNKISVYNSFAHCLYDGDVSEEIVEIINNVINN